MRLINRHQPHLGCSVRQIVLSIELVRASGLTCRAKGNCKYHAISMQMERGGASWMWRWLARFQLARGQLFQTRLNKLRSCRQTRR